MLFGYKSLATNLYTVMTYFHRVTTHCCVRTNLRQFFCKMKLRNIVSNEPISHTRLLFNLLYFSIMIG